ncbi:glycosyltransferase involved in cell wall biosynthesis [Paraburkholderia unamae]|uniref:hypothetical protein n=1 Tax=Paraburkholderia unamae TaxID=219649 RepID=UPI000DC4E094|nr:hypothetical protein [Paraburkholderia unamae]RAR60631.1 glycosyltransferase involved in cell wall biosynthesis [Paraburkholderia unamae]
MREGELEPVSLADALTEGWSYRTRENHAKRMIMTAVSPAVRGAGWGKILNDEPLSRSALLAALVGVARNSAQGLVLSFSHDDYLNVGGGVQNCVGDEQAALARQGWSYLHLCPNEPKPLLGRYTEASEVTCIANLDGARLGVVVLADLIEALGQVRSEGVLLRSVVHHMLGFAPEHILAVIEQCDAAYPPLVWIHDLFTLCPTATMLRNQVTFCNAPPVSSAVCGVCHAGRDRFEHVKRMRRFFARTRPVVLAPSATILNFWLEHAGYEHAQTHVLPPCEISFERDAPAYMRDEPLKVGFLGAPHFHKGWFAFESLARWHARDPRYEFVHLGWETLDVPNVKFIRTAVTYQDRSAMVRTAVEQGIHVAINWSMCFESFSFTMYEALAAGAYVLARRGAGNVSRAMMSTFAGRGSTVGSEIELSALFEEGGIREMVEQSRRQYGTLSYSNQTGGVLVDGGTGA